MTGNRYEFRNRWAVDASPDSAYVVLEALDRYPRWWPEVREVRKVSDQAHEVRARSLLPYDLIFVTHEGTRDPVNRVLEAKLTGDLEGFSRWTITPAPSGAGADLLFEEHVVTNRALLRRLAPIARPAFRANHALMMRHGERGLRTYLAGFEHGTT
jgi:Polyketide cyclase / dehydrase and lipid transport